jgi:hypothetical protein
VASGCATPPLCSTMKDDIRVTRQVFERYWLEANADRVNMLTGEEGRRLVDFHWALLLAARIDEESDRLLEK